MEGVAGIVLAAGQSQRFDGCKQLAPFRGKPLAWWGVKAALDSQLDIVSVIVGAEAPLVQSALGALTDDPRLTFVENMAYHEGQSTSVTAGLRAVRRSSAAAMFLMADQPLLEPGVINALLERRREFPDSIVSPVCNGRRRSPVTFARRFFPEISTLSGDVGARSVIKANGDAVQAVEFDREDWFLDIDRPTDLERLQTLGAVA